MAAAAQNFDTPERRRSYRHSCHLSCALTQRAELVDISVSGAAVKFYQAIPRGLHVWLCVAREIPELAAVEAEVLTARRQGEAFMLHLQFVNLTRAAERELNRYLIGLQTRRVV